MIKTTKILFVFILLGCTKEYNYEHSDHVDLLVVFGEVTNKRGPKLIRLSRTAPYTNNTKTGKIPPESNAKVYVVENGTTKYLFKESKIRGDYLNNDSMFIAKPGNTYTLFIKTQKGKHYQSTQEKMPGIVEVNYLTQEYVEKDVVGDDGIITRKRGYEVVVNNQDPPNIPNYYLWKWTGAYKIETQWKLGLKDPSCWRYCYKVDVPSTVGNAFKDDQVDGANFSQPVAFIEKKAGRFSGSPFYSFVLHQYGITKEVFTFWDQVSKQSNIGGQIDPPPTPIVGNIFSVEDPDEEVLGIFSAASVKTVSLAIKGEITEYLMNDKCQNIKGSQCEKPETWPF